MSNLSDFTSGARYKLLPAKRWVALTVTYGVSAAGYPTSNNDEKGWFTAPANCKKIRMTLGSHSNDKFFAVTTDGSNPTETNNNSIKFHLHNLAGAGVKDYIDIHIDGGEQIRIANTNSTYNDSVENDADHTQHLEISLYGII